MTNSNHTARASYPLVVEPNPWYRFKPFIILFFYSFCMALDEVFYSNEKTKKQINYLFYNFFPLEKQLFDSFSINPLREEGLEISSMFYANLCLRLYPLITIGFQVHIFNHSHKNQIEDWIRAETRGNLPDDIKYKTILEKISVLREKNKKNEDYLGDYYRFYKNTDYNLWPHFDLKREVNPTNTIGRIEYDKDIQPFKKTNWGKLLDVRNEIEHRGGTEAKLKVAVNCLACFHLIMKSLSYAPWGILYSWDSNIFSGVHNLRSRGILPTEF